MEILTTINQNLASWVTLVIVLALIFYTAIVIKNEKLNYLKSAITYPLQHFTFLIPHWWAEKADSTPNKMSFHRADTFYEWEAIFEWKTEGFSEIKSIEDLFKAKIAAKKILFDEGTTIIHEHHGIINNSKNPEFQNLEICRIEGTATRDQENRLYYDAVLILDHKAKGHLYCESISSVLNGAVEGPYFEEVIGRMRVSPS